jgi:hypothetical protein
LDVSVTLNNPEHIDFVLEYSLYVEDGKSVFKETGTNGYSQQDRSAPAVVCGGPLFIHAFILRSWATDGAMFEW